jgi:hypothetical protein
MASRDALTALVRALARQEARSAFAASTRIPDEIAEVADSTDADRA